MIEIDRTTALQIERLLMRMHEFAEETSGHTCAVTHPCEVLRCLMALEAARTPKFRGQA